MYFDSHAHFTVREGPEGFEASLTRAAGAGVTRVLAIGGSDALNAGALAAAAAFPTQVHVSLGFDRGMAAMAAPDAAALTATMARLRAMVAAAGAAALAVGETGLDYHYSPERPVSQRRLFEAHLALALELKRPVVVHSRDADADTLDLLGAYARAGGQGVLHCFTGELAFARGLLDLGFHISFSGILTFRTADALRAVAREVPDDRLLIETDSPHLAPVPHRGNVNEPAWVIPVAAMLANVRQCPVEHVAAVTMANASRLFRWPGV